MVFVKSKIALWNRERLLSECTNPLRFQSHHWKQSTLDWWVPFQGDRDILHESTHWKREKGRLFIQTSHISDLNNI
jgi:hypothetical protein